jgi:hypothetical protein
VEFNARKNYDITGSEQHLVQALKIYYLTNETNKSFSYI